jgi:hypothetical protein
VPPVPAEANDNFSAPPRVGGHICHGTQRPQADGWCVPSGLAFSWLCVCVGPIRGLKRSGITSSSTPSPLRPQSAITSRSDWPCSDAGTACQKVRRPGASTLRLGNRTFLIRQLALYRGELSTATQQQGNQFHRGAQPAVLGMWKPLGLCAVPLRFNGSGRAASSMVIPPFVSVGEQLPVDLYDSEQERRADAEQQHTVHRL